VSAQVHHCLQQVKDNKYANATFAGLLPCCLQAREQEAQRLQGLLTAWEESRENQAITR
jgi:hypothetical protein